MRMLLVVAVAPSPTATAPVLAMAVPVGIAAIPGATESVERAGLSGLAHVRRPRRPFTIDPGVGLATARRDSLSGNESSMTWLCLDSSAFLLTACRRG